MWNRTRVHGEVTYYKVIERLSRWHVTRNADGVNIYYRETIVLLPSGVSERWLLRDDT